MKTKTLITSMSVMVSALANAAPSVGYEAATNAAEAVVQRDVPSWALQQNPPESMTDNAVVLTNNALKTKGGSNVTAENIGAATQQTIDDTLAASNLCTVSHAESLTNGLATANDAVLVGKTNDVGRAFKLVDRKNAMTIFESNYSEYNVIPRKWLFHGTADAADSISDGTTSITPLNGLVSFEHRQLSFGVPVTSNLKPDNSPVATSNMVARIVSSSCHVTDNEVVLTNNALKTKSGSVVTAANVGARSENDQSFTALTVENGNDSYFILGSLFPPLDLSGLPEFILYDWGQIKRKTELIGTQTESLQAWVEGRADSRITATVPSWARSANKPTYTAAEVTGAQTAGDVSTAIENAGHMTSAQAEAAYYPKESGNLLANQVSVIGSHMNAEDAQCVVTNYDSLTHLPEATFRIKLNQGGTNVWRDIWKEMTRWDAFCGSDFSWATWGGFRSWSTNIEASVESKCPREYAWYDGTTGEVAPDGFFWISQPRIAICAGAAYQRYLDSGNSVWILESNGLAANVGGTTNGYFRISDEEGNAQFEIIKGEKQTVPAIARSMRSETVMGVTHWICDYSVTNAVSPPVAKFTRNLSNQTWIPDTDASCPCNVEWTAGVNTYTLEFWPKSNEPQMFCKAEYDRGGETKIRQSVPCEMQYIILNGTRYGLVPKTVNGELVLGLTTGN